LRAVNIEPPVTDKIFLVKKGAIWTEEAVLDKTPCRTPSTDVECLAFSFWISVVTSFYLAITKERCFRHLRIYWIVFTRLPRNCFSKSIESILGSTSTVSRRTTVDRDFITNYKL
jgi:hypothetical protein